MSDEWRKLSDEKKKPNKALVCFIICFQVTGTSSIPFKIEPGQPKDVMQQHDGEEGDDENLSQEGIHGYHLST